MPISGFVVVGEGVVEDQHVGLSDLRLFASLVNVRELHCGQTAAPVDAEEALIDSFRHGQARCEIRQSCDTAAPCGDLVSATEDLGMRGRSVPRPVVREKFALEAGDIDADRTFRLAGPALQAEIQHVVHALVAETGFAEASGHCEAKHICASARADALLPGRHVGWAHRSIEFLATDTEAAAHLDCTAHSAVFRVVEKRWGCGSVVSGAKAEIACQGRGIDDLARDSGSRVDRTSA